jgi:hypothetical protein
MECWQNHIERELFSAPDHLSWRPYPKKIAAIYILQQKMNFEPVIETPFGTTKAEVRSVYLELGAIAGVDDHRNGAWQDDGSRLQQKHGVGGFKRKIISCGFD